MPIVHGNVLRLGDQTVIRITRQDHEDYITTKKWSGLTGYCYVKMRHWYYSNFDVRKSYSSVNESISNSRVGSECGIAFSVKFRLIYRIIS